MLEWLFVCLIVSVVTVGCISGKRGKRDAEAWCGSVMAGRMPGQGFGVYILIATRSIPVY